MMRRTLAWSATLLWALMAPAALAQSFDGNWEVTLVCPQEPGGAKAYTYQFYAQVAGGVLRGQYGTPGRVSSMTLEGSIRPDGVAYLIVNGLTGDPGHTLDHVNQGTPYSYHVNARFAGVRGTGSRVEGRACSLAFARS